MKKILFLFILCYVNYGIFAQQKLQHVSTLKNISNNSTFINAEGLNNNPNAIIIVEYDAATAKANPHAVGVWYNGGQWAIFNQDRAAMPEGLTFNLTWKNADANAYTHKVVNGNTILDHPSINNNPSAFFYASQVWNPGGVGGVYNNADITVNYNQQTGKWLVVNINNTNIPEGAAFNILVAAKNTKSLVNIINSQALPVSPKNLKQRFTTGFSLPSENILSALHRNLSPNIQFLYTGSTPDAVIFTENESSRKFDLRTYNCVTPVRSQGNCGSCCSFAAIAAYESAILMRNGGNPLLLDLSEQQVLNCTGTFLGLSNRCGGGMHWDVMGYMKNVKKIVTEGEYPYRDATNDCSVQNPQSNFEVEDVIGIANHRGEVSRMEIKEAIIRYGSVVACIWATDSIQNYLNIPEDRVFSKNINSAGWGQPPNHVIQIIGWDDDKNAWLIKNSWNTDWGTNGFAWIEYEANVIGGYATCIKAKRVSSQAVQAGFANQSMPDMPADVDMNAVRIRLSPAIVYEFKNSNNEMVMDVQDDVAFKGTEIRQANNHNGIWLCDGRNQEWIFLYAGEREGLPVYRILNFGFRRFITANPNPSCESFSIAASGMLGQLWYVLPVSGVYNKWYLKSVSSGRYITMPGTNNEFHQYSMQPLGNAANQQFTFIRYNYYPGQTNRVEPGAYRFNAFYADNKSFDIPAGNTDNGASIMTIWDKQPNGPTQKLTIENSNEAGAYYIKPGLNLNKCLQVFQSPLEPPGIEVPILWDATGTDDQKWYIVPSIRQGNTFLFINKKTGQALTVKNRETNNGSRLIMVDYQDAENQRWRIERH